MLCPTCGSRRAKRHCPALERAICTVCCGTKRQAEIRCPADCPYLSRADLHPPSAVRKQRERDFTFAAPMVHRLSDAAYGLLLAFQDTIARHRQGAIPALVDADVAEACEALAATLETSARGIIYEHHAASMPAQRLATDLRTTLAGMARTPSASLEREAATALRRIQQAARGARAALGGGAAAYLDFLDRMPRNPASSGVETSPDESGAALQPASGPSRLIIP